MELKEIGNNQKQNDLGRFLLILVTRSVALSNTQYSLLLEEEGIFINLHREWISSLVRYKGAYQSFVEPRCLSIMFNRKDKDYTDAVGDHNDECEYFVNGIINNDKLFIQGLVFDFTFEVDFDLGRGLKLWIVNYSP